MLNPLLAEWRLGALETGDHVLGAFETPEAWRIGWADKRHGNVTQGFQDKANKDTYPFADPERIRWQDSTTCVRVLPANIVLTGIAVELARIPIAKNSVGIPETVGTWFDIDALDVQGVAIFSFSTWPPGASACQLPLTHPDPNVENPLTLRWRLVADQQGYQARETLPPLGALFLPSALPSVHLVEPDWTDLRYAYESDYSRWLKNIVQGPSLVRLFCVLTGDEAVWDVRMRGRVQGYWQPGGYRGGALRSALNRIG